MSTAGTETIAAISTAPGRGGIGIVRVSGPGCARVAAGVIGRAPVPRHAELHSFCDAEGGIIDFGLALFFPAPHSYTGEDVLELHGHGGPVVMDLLFARVLELGARAATPGEFTQRAFLNDKLDLAQAEAVADLIDSGSAQAARAAVRSLEGAFSIQVRELTEAVLQLRLWVEAAIDFPEEEIDFLADRGLAERMTDLRERFVLLDAAARQGALLRDGLTLVIAGRPNAGKSSLLNRLAGYDAAIVTAAPGTTRDVLRERIEIDGLPVHVLDTAGLRASVDEIELEGIRRAEREIAESRDALAAAIGAPVRHFCYPNSGGQHAYFGPAVSAILKKLDFRSATTSRPGALAPGADPFLLPRLGVSPRLADVPELATAMERQRLAA